MSGLRNLNLTGKRFGRLVAVEICGKNSRNENLWLCKCDCGNTHITRTGLLTSEQTKSCGCLRRGKTAISGRNCRLKEGESSFNSLFRLYKYGATSRNIEFILSKEVFRELITSNCHYCGKPPSQLHNKSYYFGSLLYSGIDRVDNSKNYTIDNVVPCCKSCNSSKRDRNLEYFLLHSKTLERKVINESK